MTEAQAERRKVLALEIVDRYVLDKGLEPLPPKMWAATVKSYDEHLTRAGVPTGRFRDVYLEAMAAHGPYLLTIVDYVAAWRRMTEGRTERLQTAYEATRGENCAICQGKGFTLVYLPKEDIEVQKECPYHCNVVMAMQRA